MIDCILIDQSQTRLSTSTRTKTPLNSPYNPLVTGVVVVYIDPRVSRNLENFLGVFLEMIID
jgi:hypothetical protein